MSNHTPYHGKRILPEAYHALAASRGFEWIGEYSDVRTKTTWRCSLGHEWNAPYYSIQAGTGCPKCGNARKREKKLISADAYHALAAKWGITWLDSKPLGVDIPTKWRGQCGHEWYASYTNIKKGALCPPCSDEKAAVFRRKSPWDYADLGRVNNLIWIGPVVTSTWIVTQWQCSCGNVWESSYDNIKQGYGCPLCGVLKAADTRRTKPDEYQALATSSRITWIGPYVNRVTIPTGWRCPKGHEWNACYNSIYNGSNCPYCQDIINGAKVSQVQFALAKLLNGEVNLKVGTYSLDVALEVGDIRIAVEYDAYYWHREVRDMTTFERNRDAYLFRRGWRMIRVRSNALLPTIDQLDCAITEILNGQTSVEIILDDWRSRK